jgi:hypothetical protein
MQAACQAAGASATKQKEGGHAMTRLLLCTATILALTASALLSSASAQHGPLTKEELDAGIRIKEFTRYIPSGKNRNLYFAHALKRDCSPADEYDVKVLKQPEHGTVELISGDGPANFPKDTERFKCNGKKVRGINIVYKSAPGYAGPDNLHMIFLLEYGIVFEVHYKLNVVR